MHEKLRKMFSEETLSHPWTVHGSVDWTMWYPEFSKFAHTLADYTNERPGHTDTNVMVPLLAFFLVMYVQGGYGIVGLKLLVHSLFYGTGQRFDSSRTLWQVGRLLEFYTEKEALKDQLPSIRKLLSALAVGRTPENSWIALDPRTGVYSMTPYILLDDPGF